MTSIVAQSQPHLFQHLNPLQCGLVGRLVPVCPKVLCNPDRLDSPQQWVYTHTDGRYAGRRRRFRSPLKPLESVHGGLLAVKKTIISVSSGSNTKSSDSAQSDLIKSNLNISSLGFPPREELACFFLRHYFPQSKANTFSVGSLHSLWGGRVMKDISWHDKVKNI